MVDASESVVRGAGGKKNSVMFFGVFSLFLPPVTPGAQSLSKVSFEVELRDNRGLVWTEAVEDLQVEIRAPNNKIVKSDTRREASGTYEVSYVRALPGFYNVGVKVSFFCCLSPC